MLNLKSFLCAALLFGMQSVLQAQLLVVTTNTVSSPRVIALAWDPSPDSSVTGYHLKYGSASGNCTNSLDVGNVTSLTLGGLVSASYYFVVVAYSADGQESLPSNEINYVAPAFYPQTSLTFQSASSQVFGTTNLLTASGGSGSGSWSYSVVSGPGLIVNGNSLLITAGTGTVLVAAKRNADQDYYAASITNQVLAAKASQTIAFGNIGSQMSTNVVTLAATASSGLAVSFDVVSGPGTILANQLRFSQAGTVVVAARQTGSADYNAAASITNTVTVTKILAPPSGLHLQIN